MCLGKIRLVNRELNMVKKLGIAFLTLAMVLSLTSCSKIAEKAIENAINRTATAKLTSI